MFRRERSDAEALDAIIPGSKGAYYLIRIGGFLALVTFTGLGGFALFSSSNSEDETRPVLEHAGPSLALGVDGVDLLKKLGGTSCTSKEAPPEASPGASPKVFTERWVFHVRGNGGGETDDCIAEPGDLTVWVEGRIIVAFEPVHGDGEIVQDEEGFQRYQRRYTHGAPPGGPRR